MTTANPGSSDPNAVVRGLAADVRNRHLNQLRELRIEVVEGGIVLRGRATSFYGKQIAFHEVSRLCELGSWKTGSRFRHTRSKRLPSEARSR
jgi:hypothetical protein